MGRPIIVLGDRTNKGGRVIEASMFTSTHGKGWARVGDRVSCHLKCRIATGDPFLIDDGRAVARHGDKTTCGQTLISSQLFTTDAIEGSAAKSPETEASLAFAPPEFSDAGRNSPAPGMQPAQFLWVEKRDPLPPLSIPGETVPQTQDSQNNLRSRDDARSRPSRPPGRAPLTDAERKKSEAPLITVPDKSAPTVLANPSENKTNALPPSQSAKPSPALPGKEATKTGSTDHILNSEVEKPTPTQIAQEGGRHAGQLEQFRRQTPDQLQRTIRSFDKQIENHQGWLVDPTSKVPNFYQLRPEHQQNLLHHWGQDIARHQELKSIAENVLKGL